MKYEYRDEPTVELSGRTLEEIENVIEKLEMKNYGHLLSKSFPEKKHQKTIKLKCHTKLDIKNKIAL